MDQLSLGISTCPNDTFAFYALLHQNVSPYFHFQTTLTDIEHLNTAVLKQTLDVSKVSIHAFFYALSHYKLLSVGAALGDNCGPLLVGLKKQVLKTGKIAIPGRFTTAALLFQIFYGTHFEFQIMPFDKIMDAVLKKRVDAGVLIHESRFTYAEHGLVCLEDLGERWFAETGQLIPLGGIAVSRQLAATLQEQLNQALKASILYARLNPLQTVEFVNAHAAELSPQVIQQHIDLYVNHYTEELGKKGRRAIRTLYEKGLQQGLFPTVSAAHFDNCFVL